MTVIEPQAPLHSSSRPLGPYRPQYICRYVTLLVVSKVLFTTTRCCTHGTAPRSRPKPWAGKDLRRVCVLSLTAINMEAIYSTAGAGQYFVWFLVFRACFTKKHRVRWCRAVYHHAYRGAGTCFFSGVNSPCWVIISQVESFTQPGVNQCAVKPEKARPDTGRHFAPVKQISVIAEGGGGEATVGGTQSHAYRL